MNKTLFKYIIAITLLILCCIGYSDVHSRELSTTVIVFRLDDIVLSEKQQTGLPYDQEFQNNLIAEFIKRGIPLTLGVIPYWKEQEIPIINSIAKRFDQQIRRGTIEIAQHGFRHQSSAEKQTEFRGIAYDSQLEWMKKGKTILERAFSTQLITFVPPWNNYDANTIRVLTRLKFKCLSGDLGPLGKIDNDKLKIIQGPIAYVPASCSFREVRHAIDLSFSSHYHSSSALNIIVVAFHPYDFISFRSNAVPKADLITLLNDLKHMPVELATLAQVTTRYGDELDLSRQIRAARVETLGKSLKLIPGLGGLLPTDYNFGRWIPFGVYLSEEVYSSIEKRILINIVLFLLGPWIFFMEGLHLVLGRKMHAWKIATWALIGSIFCLSVGLYFLLIPERVSLSLAGIWASGIYLLYWIIRVLISSFFVFKKSHETN